MKFADYLSEHDITDQAFAASIGCDRTTVLRWRNGAIVPDTRNQLRIYQITDGKVSPNDWLPAFGVEFPSPPTDAAAA